MNNPVPFYNGESKSLKVPVEVLGEGAFLVHSPAKDHGDLVFVNNILCKDFPISVSESPVVKIYTRTTRPVLYRNRFAPAETMTPEEHYREHLRLQSKSNQTEDGRVWESPEAEYDFRTFEFKWLVETEPALVLKRTVECEFYHHLKESEVPRFMQKVEHFESIPSGFIPYKRAMPRAVRFDAKLAYAEIVRETLESGGFVQKSSEAASKHQIYQIFDYAAGEVTVHVGGSQVIKKTCLSAKVMTVEDASKELEKITQEIRTALAPVMMSTLTLSNAELISSLNHIKQSVLGIDSKQSTRSKKSQAASLIDNLLAKIANSAQKGVQNP